MSTNASTKVILNPQTSSQFFLLPLEIRQEIYGFLVPYGVHASFHQNKRSLSLCIQSHPDNSFDGYDRSGLGDTEPFGTPDPLLLPRLQSTWGPHWECEEIALGINHSVEDLRKTKLSFPRTCKKARSDIINYIFNVAIVHVTDLDTLHHLVSQDPAATSGELYVSEKLFSAAMQIHNLSITLRLPLKTFRRIERDNDDISRQTPTDTRDWMRLCLALSGLNQLRRLYLWADHNSVKSWTMVNERAFLLPLDELLVAVPRLDINVNLPKLHPKYESPERHFVPGGTVPQYTITRRIRQRLHAVTSGTTVYKKWVADFPITYEDSFDGELESVEECERQMWANGIDVEAKVRSWSTTRICYDWPPSTGMTSEDEEDE